MPEPMTLNPQTLQEEIDRAHKELMVLYEVSNAMRTTLELNHILYIILTGVTAHTGLGFNRAILFLVNNKDRCLEPKMAIGPESGEHAQKIWEYVSSHHIDDLIKEERMSVNIQQTTQSALFQSIKHLSIPMTTTNNLLGTAFHQGECLLLSEQDLNLYSQDSFVKIFHSPELVVMPLKAKDNVNGLIVADNVYTRKSVTKEDLKIFTMLANQAGLAIENSRLYEMTKYQSHIDSLTELWNHGFLQNKLLEEIEKAKTSGQPLSLILLDIDNFKRLNDTCGHQQGDLVLKEIAKILKKSSRTNDHPCRYGGEELALILPQTSVEQGLAIAERIRQNIAEYHFANLSSRPEIKVSVSIGLAAFPQHAQTKEELINKTDQAMYIAKFGGKNQTCVAN